MLLWRLLLIYHSLLTRSLVFTIFQWTRTTPSGRSACKTGKVFQPQVVLPLEHQQWKFLLCLQRWRTMTAGSGTSVQASRQIMEAYSGVHFLRAVPFSVFLPCDTTLPYTIVSQLFAHFQLFILSFFLLLSRPVDGSNVGHSEIGIWHLVHSWSLANTLNSSYYEWIVICRYFITWYFITELTGKPVIKSIEVVTESLMMKLVKKDERKLGKEGNVSLSTRTHKPEDSSSNDGPKKTWRFIIQGWTKKI